MRMPRSSVPLAAGWMLERREHCQAAYGIKRLQLLHRQSHTLITSVTMALSAVLKVNSQANRDVLVLTILAGITMDFSIWMNICRIAGRALRKGRSVRCAVRTGLQAAGFFHRIVTMSRCRLAGKHDGC